ncbi:MAG TPA: TetR family transcriptional regulator [Bryobacteraceae bacterium]|nr:TetR family transcriptional regulator [Bryobacteraceae bacterium]
MLRLETEPFAGTSMDPERTPTIETPAPSDRSTPERVLDTAAALFWEKGYAAATTREIAAAVGIQQASLYYHVNSKEGLLYQLCVSSMEQLLADVQSSVQGHRDPLDQLRALVGAHLSTLVKHQIRHVTMLTELRALSKRHHAEVLALRRKYADLVRSVLEQAQATGKIRTDIPARYLYLALLNILNWAVVWFRRDQALNADQLADVFWPIFLRGTLASSARLSLELPNLNNHRRRAPKSAKSSKTARKLTSERLLDAAASLFAARGYGATSTREIAAALGIQKASLYYHIGSKEELLFGVCKSSLEQIRADVEAAVAGVPDRLEKIRALICAHVESLLRDQEKHSVAMAEMHLLSADRLAQVRALRDAYENLVRSVLHEAQNTGLLRQDVPVKYLCLSLLGLMNRLEVWYRRGGPLSPHEFGQLLGVIFLTGAAA